MKDVDVAVVGGGPVGLWVACELRLAGLETVVLERRSTPMAQSRALTMHGRTLELFAMRGVAERFLAEGRPIPTGHYAALDTRLDFSVFDTRYPFMLFLPQSRTEALIEDRARELGVEILRGHEVTGITGRERQDYRLSARHERGEASFHARAVIGADARRSIVRQTASIAFEGHDATLSIMMGDVCLRGLDGPPMRMVSNACGGVTIVPVGRDGATRVIVVDPERIHVPVGEPLTLGELASSARRILGEDIELCDPIWLSRFGDETRLATHYRSGRMFLAGDAAHLHLPAGGQGMNVGLQDAMNLGWKLAAVLNGTAPEALLDTYEKERRPVGAQLARNTEAQGALMTHFDPSHLALRAEMSELLRMPDVNRRLAGVLSGFDLQYPPVGLFTGEAGAGQRLPDRDVILADGTATSLYRLLTPGTWLHLSCEGGVQTTLPGWLPTEAVRFAVTRGTKLEVSGREAHAVLIRPDGYTAGAELARR
ncbi:FAD-dependent oxidoreductase [Rhizobium mayense]|uniref:FAD-dependent oxidoreductase n=1 Tax=Rhizobium mayense TaxID=1312184 RepID=UPI00398C6583